MSNYPGYVRIEDPYYKLVPGDVQCKPGIDPSTIGVVAAATLWRNADGYRVDWYENEGIAVKESYKSGRWFYRKIEEYVPISKRRLPLNKFHSRPLPLP